MTIIGTLLPNDGSVYAVDFIANAVVFRSPGTGSVGVKVIRDLKDFEVQILSGAGSGQVRFVASNTDTTLTLTHPWDIVPQASDAYFYGPVNPNTLNNPANAVNTLNVFNNDSVGNDAGVLTDSRLYGLGMGGGATIAGRTFQAGITYGDIQKVNVFLGSGNNNFTVQSTATSATTVVNTGRGTNTVNVQTIGGHTIVNSGSAGDTIDVGTTAPATGG